METDADEVLKELYNIMTKISENKKNSDNAEQNAALFRKILELPRSQSADSRSKRLASQFVGRLFKDFPEDQPAAFEAMVDLVEDDDLNVRKQAISDLPKLCKDVPVYVAKVTDLLVQMLQSDDPQEQPLVNNALSQTLTGHPAEALTGLFNQLTHEEASDLTRERALRFLTAKLAHLALTPPQEELLSRLLIDELLYDVSEDEFTTAVNLLAGLGCMRGAAGRQRLVDAVCQQADLAAPFDPASPADVARLSECARMAAKHMGRNVSAKALLVYYLDRVVPSIDLVDDSASGPGLADSPRLGLLRRLAELSSAADRVPVTNSDFLTACPDRLADFAKRIGYLSQANQVYLRSLRSAVRAPPRAEDAVPTPAAAVEDAAPSTQPDASDDAEKAEKAEEPKAAEPPIADPARLREVALATAENIALLARDLSRSPPSYRAELAVSCLSWRQLAASGADRLGKRRGEVSDDEEEDRGGARRRFAGDQRSSDRRARDRFGGGGGGMRSRRGGGGGGWRSNRW
uniref:Apoptosis inhibitor 5 n=1 Tax=Macrostomum lignano TaxID=282301 RepID=A0A1I8IAR2_9PLAT